MENYQIQIIKKYLSTFPEGTSVKDVVDNITSAEERYIKTLDKRLEEMKENVGKCFYEDDFDDGMSLIKWFYKINNVKRVHKGGDEFGTNVYEVEMIEICDGTINHTAKEELYEEDVFPGKEIPVEEFDKLQKLVRKVEKFDVD